VHSGMTSSDVLDTSFNAAGALSRHPDGRRRPAAQSMKKRAYKHKKTPTIGRRTASMPSRRSGSSSRSPMSLAGQRAPAGGAQGSATARSPARSALRDRSAGRAHVRRWGSRSSRCDPIIRATATRCSCDARRGRRRWRRRRNRHLQRTEVLEAEEFLRRQKGLSAMPHKRNPVLSENITGFARWCAPTRCRRWRMWRCGTSAIFPTHRSNG
jgi:adenylosuccinate lyase